MQTAAALLAVCFLWASVGAAQVPPDWQPDDTAPMRFQRAYTGGNCLTCTFVAAQGVITRDTPAEFGRFLAQLGRSDLSGSNIHLHSRGGHLDAALELGQMIRASGAGTVVARTSGQITDYGLSVSFQDSTDAVCLSACVYAFIGGKQRFAVMDHAGEQTGYQRSGRLGVHQFYSTGTPAPSGQRNQRAEDQTRVAGLLTYVADMGVSADLLVLGLNTPSDDMRVLTNDEAISLRLHTYGSEQTEVRLRGYPNGVGIIEVETTSQLADVRIEMFCRADAQAADSLHLKLHVLWQGLDWQSPDAPDLTRFFETLYTRAGPLRLIAQEHGRSSAGPVISTVSFAVPGATARSQPFRQGIDFENATWSWFDKYAQGLDAPIAPGFDGFDLLPRLCIR